jgi:hypothetical protein
MNKELGQRRSNPPKENRRTSEIRRKLKIKENRLRECQYRWKRENEFFLQSGRREAAIKFTDLIKFSALVRELDSV